MEQILLRCSYFMLLDLSLVFLFFSTPRPATFFSCQPKSLPTQQQPASSKTGPGGFCEIDDADPKADCTNFFL
jgi:hypothetical protein